MLHQDTGAELSGIALPAVKWGENLPEKVEEKWAEHGGLREFTWPWSSAPVSQIRERRRIEGRAGRSE